MCGIHFSVGCDLSSADFMDGLNAIKHRGPDHTGYLEVDEIKFGHVRLSILDLSGAANQPFQYKNLIGVFNGEFFNYIEEKEILEEHGYSFNTSGDTEVIFAMYDFYGESFIKRVNGMFSLVIYDKTEGFAYAYRDRFGIKPFFYTKVKGGIVISSELKGLFATCKVPLKWNKKVVSSYILDGVSNYNNETFYENFYQLEPGRYIKIDLNGNLVKQVQYYNNSENSSNSKNDLNTIFKDSVRIRLRTDVGFAVSFSGGIDSTLVTDYVSDEIPKGKLSVFSMLRDDKEDFDSFYSEKYKNLKPENNYFFKKPSTENIQSLAEKVCMIQDEPIAGPSIVMQYLMYQSVSYLGIKVLIEGQGGDEVFLGYERYLVGRGFSKFFLTGYFLQLAKNSRLTIAQTIAYWFTFRFPVFRRIQKKRLFKNSYSKLADFSGFNYLESFSKSLKKGTVRNLELSSHQLRSLLNFSDRNSMHFGLEARLPFLDVRLVNEALKYDDSELSENGWSKSKLRDLLSVRGLEEFGKRKYKNGFEAPKSANVFEELVAGERSSIEEFFNIETPNDRRLQWSIMSFRFLEKNYGVRI